MKKRYLQVVLLSLIVSGCSVGPVYETPYLDIPCEWHEDTPEPLYTQQAPDDIIWWRSLEDELLNELMAAAAEQNLDLHIAAMRVLQARAEAKAKKGDLYPHIDASANYGHVRYSRDALVTGLLGNEIPIKSRHHDHRNFNFFEVGFDAEWEIDLFGMRTHEINALKAQEEAVQENLCNIWVTLSAEIAKNYIELRGLQQKFVVLQKKIKLQDETIQLYQQLLERGMVDDLTVNNALAEWSEINAQQPMIELGIARAIHRLSILLGYAPGELQNCLSVESPLPKLPAKQPIGMPSELLRRRPDIRKAERELAAATERIGTAIAALFPRFSLRGFVGDISSNAGTLFNPSSATWFVGPQLMIPVFNSKLLLQEVEYNKIVTREALFNYQKVVLEALEESENAIAAYRYGEEQLQFLESVYGIRERTYVFADQLYQNGINDYLTVATTSKSLLIAEDALIQSKVDLLLHYVSLYKALGGSWE